MTSISLNQPCPSLHGQNQLFISAPNSEDSTSITCHTLFKILDSRQTIEIREFRDYDQEDSKLVLHDGSSSNHQVYNSSFISPHPVKDEPSMACDHNLSFFKNEEQDSKNGHGSPKWMSSKMRLMKKMMRPHTSPSTDKTTITAATPRSQYQVYENRHIIRSPHNNGNNTTIRVCSDCNTSSTPLWRSGPNGPKSLCNACGIRQRKARRAMAEAANGLTLATDASSTKTRVHNKEKKSHRTNHLAQFKNKFKSTATSAGGSRSSSHGEKKLQYFKDLAQSWRNNSAFQQVFPRDEVAEAALLLMDLSCGFV
ncbi:hypothetical protein RIF29_05830 [Crotalaria pallida]|uniref:GATA-type domain-containing protein n=1 Tax=Crotalaria pallida TaxID=3830 RepID=A0AAN9J2H7_CROPI